MDRPSVDQQITFLYTTDMARSITFYEDILQLPLVLDQGGCRIYKVAGAAYVGICERSHAVVEPKGVIITLVTSDVDGWHAHLREHSVKIDKPPSVNDAYGIYHCFARDPNGYLIEIQRFLDPDWHERHG